MSDITHQAPDLLNHGTSLHPILQQIDRLNNQYGQVQAILVDGDARGQDSGGAKEIVDDIVTLAQDSVNESIR